VPDSALRALIAAAGVGPRTPAAAVTAENWHQIGRRLAGRYGGTG
jgi:hypothetical protein